MADDKDTLGLIGQTLGEKYIVEACIADGGFSQVYRAQHRIWREPVAIKCFTALSQADNDTREALLESFVREGRLMSQLSSQTAAVVQARDIGSHTTANGRWFPYLVLEWLDGAPLSEILDAEHALHRPPRTLRESLLALEGIMHALSLAHAMGIAHLDIKPDNIIVCGDSLREGVTTKILDFGVAKVLDRRHKGGGEYAGRIVSMMTPDYAAPEQYEPRFGPTGPATDVFAMALVLLEVLRGGTPVLAEGLVLDEAGFATMRERCTRATPRPTPRSLGLVVSDEVEGVFERALAVDVACRYVDMASFANALRRAEKLPELVVRAPLDALQDRLEQASARLPTQKRVRAQRMAITVEAPRGMANTTIAGYEEDDDFPVVPTGLSRRWLAIGAGVVTAAVAVFLWQGAAGQDQASAAETSTTTTLAAATKPPEVKRCPDGMQLIPGGKFFMGSDADEMVLFTASPPHQVELPDYCMDRTEVTVAAYRACSQTGECQRAYRDSTWARGGSSKREWKRSMAAHSQLCNENFDDHDQHPVNCVTWEQADAFCKHVGKTLPSEAQWEFAARGSDGRTFPWGDELPSELQINGCGQECLRWRVENGQSETPVLYDKDDGYPGTAPVASLPRGRTQHGLADMIGNVFEWTADAYLPYEGASSSVTKRFPDTQQRVIRGGAFNSFMAQFANPALRFGQEPEMHPHAVGFRCASIAQPELSTQ